MPILLSFIIPSIRIYLSFSFPRSKMRKIWFEVIWEKAFLFDFNVVIFFLTRVTISQKRHKKFVGVFIGCTVGGNPKKATFWLLMSTFLFMFSKYFQTECTICRFLVDSGAGYLKIKRPPRMFSLQLWEADSSSMHI